MARNAKNLASGVSSTSLAAIYTTASNITAYITKLILTNTSTGAIEFSVYVNSVLLVTDKVAGGSGKARIVYEVNDLVLNSNDVLQLVTDSTGINYSLSGWEIS